MKKATLIVILGVLTCAQASAESSVWKAQKDNSVIYLGGTCHILREADYPLPPEFDKAYKASDTLVCETDLGVLQEPATAQKIMAKAVYADGTTVDKHLSAQAYEALSAYCKSNGVPLAAMKQFKPSMILLALASRELMKLGVTQKGVDLFFYKQAATDKKPVEGLEKVDEQIDFIVSMGDGNEDDFVTQSISDMKNTKDQFEILVDAWRKGDGGRLSDLMVAEVKTKAPKIYRQLITDRNLKWLSSIDAYQKTPSTEFVLVGVAHLVGPDGIIEALRKKGYKVDKL